ncbi:MAG: phosphoribosyl-AMP cyclohydrolase [Candidatus Altiarchaeales archaeon IMC4]|nr:MAG: phosphoribosyl-AMP cyclohydrolase [Candidatus Altiarchaeales archaeon IMC4]
MAVFPFEVLKKRTIDGVAGLVTVIAQDAETGDVLMQAYTNEEGIRKTIETKKAHYFSTSRGKLWLKGESSGHTQEVKEILIDCDGDALLFKVEQQGGACHLGYGSCFFRKVSGGNVQTIAKKVFNPEEVYQ